MRPMVSLRNQLATKLPHLGGTFCHGIGHPQVRPMSSYSIQG
jgi:hypothetical protein